MSENDSQVSPTPFISKETGIAVIAATNHMARHTGQKHPCFTGHRRLLSTKNPVSINKKRVANE